MSEFDKETVRSGNLTANQPGQALENDTGGIYDGTVGWNDGSAHYNLETGGVTLVKVTLFHGHNPADGATPNDGRAHGHLILARISAPLFHVPPDGAQVIVAMPAARWGVPGAALIIGAPVNSPDIQFNPNKSKLDFGAETDLFIKARSITLSDYEDRYLTLGPTYGVKIGDKDANGCQLKDAKWAFYTAEDGTAVAAFQLAKAGIKLMVNDGQMCAVTMKNGIWLGMGTKFEAQFSMGALGKLVPGATPALFGIAYSPTGPVNLFSGTWCVAPA